MNSLVAQMMGRKVVQEDDSVPLPGIRGQPDSDRGRSRRATQRQTQRSTAAALMGIIETDEEDGIIPDNAEEIKNISGPSGVRMDDKGLKHDREAEEPDHPTAVDEPAAGEDRLLSPRDALVAPDLTPHALEPIDPSEVPAPAHAEPEAQASVPKFVPPNPTANTINPMDVLLGRRTAGPETRRVPEEPVVTAESAQATVNASLGVSGQVGLNENVPMPDHKPGSGQKIMETFYRYGPKPNWNF